MKTIGLLGGMSWESTALYYRLINEETKRIRGGLHSAPVVMLSVDFHEIEKFQEQGDWDAAAALLADKARVIESAGADLLLICTNTMHKVAGTVSAAIGIPLLHIADASVRGSPWSKSFTGAGWNRAASRCLFPTRWTGHSCIALSMKNSAWAV
jgi:aspartate racemase